MIRSHDWWLMSYNSSFHHETNFEKTHFEKNAIHEARNVKNNRNNHYYQKIFPLTNQHGRDKKYSHVWLKNFLRFVFFILQDGSQCCMWIFRKFQFSIIFSFWLSIVLICLYFWISFQVKANLFTQFKVQRTTWTGCLN